MHYKIVYAMPAGSSSCTIWARSEQEAIHKWNVGFGKGDPRYWIISIAPA